jgi:hypothetical protein
MDVPSLLLNIGSKANQGMSQQQFNELRARFPERKGMPRAQIRLGALGNVVAQPNINISASTTASESPVYIDGAKQENIKQKEFGGGGQIGWDFPTPSGHRFGGAAQGQYTKGKVDFPDVLRQFGVPDEQKYGTRGVDFNKITGYYSHPEGYYAEGDYNPVTDDYNFMVGFRKRF